ncbi:MAG: three-Cys-motif partner protein TcmP [Phototrophicaceae bacterium]
MTENYLLPVDDGLPMRTSQEYAKYKLDALSHYIHQTNVAMRDKWLNRFYLDLQAGPGKNKIGQEVWLGSPLLALTAPFPATRFFFNEYDPAHPEVFEALKTRVQSSPFHPHITLLQKDVNNAALDIVNLIPNNGKNSLNLAFLDPEGLEMDWRTVETLAKIARMDMIINFSTSGIIRSIGKGYEDVVTRFFGTDEWKSIYQQADKSNKSRVLIDFYRQQLEKFGYNIQINPNLGGHDISIRNSRNAEVYSLIFASKHPLGDKFWKQAKKSALPPKLPGFE